MIPMQKTPDYRLAMGQALLSGGGYRSGHPVADAVSQAGRQLMGAYLMKSGYDREEQRTQETNKTLADALAGAQEVKPWVNPDSGELMPGTTPNDYLAKALLANEDTAPMGMQFAMTSMGNREKSALDAAQYNRQRRDTRDDMKFKHDLASEAPKSALGKLKADYDAGLISDEDYRAGVSKATSNTPLVSMGPGETEEAKGIGRGLADRYNALQEQGAAARKNMGTLADIEPLIDQVSTGTGAGAGIAVKSFMKRVGLDPTSIGLADDVAPAEAFRSLSNQLTLMLRSSEGMPASGFSDADRSFLENIPPNIGNTPEGNKLLAELLRKKFQRTQQRAWEAQKYYNEKGTFRGFELENPMGDIFDMQDREKLLAISQSAMPAYNTAGPPMPSAPAPKADALPGQPDEDALDAYLRSKGLSQ